MRLAWGDYELDEERFELRREGVKVPVQPKVLELLFMLVRARERVVLRRELFDTIWAGVVVSEASLSRAVLEARRAVGDELQQVLVTVRGRGFRFTAEVVERSADGSAQRAEPPVDPTFVGRESAMTCLAACLDEARRGHGSVVWISGDAGIGKTRTADEFGRRARAGESAAAVFSASAHETPEAPPFWLWAQVTRAYAATLGAARGAELLEAVAPLLAGAADLPNEFALFDTLTRAFIEGAAARPLVLAFDDVHWADEGSQRLLRFFAREVRRAAIVIVCTYRDTEARGQARGARGRAFGLLLGECPGLSIPLRGLSPSEVPRFVDVTSGTVPSEAVAAALYDRTGGNPLYLRHALQTEWAERALTETAHKLASSMDLQQGLVESIQRHLLGVSPEGREVLTTAAVLGRAFTFTELLLATGLEQAALLDRLDEGARARILLHSKAGGYSFTHALVQDVLYKSLSSAERAEHHARIAARLHAHYGASLDAHAAALAFHYGRALPRGDATLAFELSALAARRASAAGEHRDAARFWVAASEALTHLAPDDARHVEARLGAAEAHALSGDVLGARVAFVDAATLARTFGKREALADAALGFARVTDRGTPMRGALLTEARASLDGAPGDASAGARARLDALLLADARAG